jgi:hypothetical protein
MRESASVRISAAARTPPRQCRRQDFATSRPLAAIFRERLLLSLSRICPRRRGPGIAPLGTCSRDHARPRALRFVALAGCRLRPRRGNTQGSLPDPGHRHGRKAASREREREREREQPTTLTEGTEPGACESRPYHQEREARLPECRPARRDQKQLEEPLSKT